MLTFSKRNIKELELADYSSSSLFVRSDLRKLPTPLRRTWRETFKSPVSNLLEGRSVNSDASF
jgi:hypothetical protein